MMNFKKLVVCALIKNLLNLTIYSLDIVKFLRTDLKNYQQVVVFMQMFQLYIFILKA